MAVALQTVGRALQSTDNLVKAARLFGSVESLREGAGAPFYPAERVDFDRDVDALRKALGRAAFDVAWNEGREMSAAQASEYALHKAAPTGADVAPGQRAATRKPDRLTARERQVAIMIGRGYTNRQIAEELVIVEKTAEVHARNIRQKLGLPTRATLAAWVVQRDLLPAST